MAANGVIISVDPKPDDIKNSRDPSFGVDDEGMAGRQFDERQIG